MRGVRSSACTWATILYLGAITVFLIYSFWLSTYPSNEMEKKTLRSEVKQSGKHTEPTFLVPNIVHFIRFKQPNVTLVDMACIKSALEIIKPEKLFIHCDDPPIGKYWDMIKNHTAIKVVLREKPTHIFERPIGNHLHHASDVTRLEILMEQGGIYLDNDVYVIKPFDTFRKYMFTVGWSTQKNEKSNAMGNMILVSTRHARFLLEYYDTYHMFNNSMWYFNAGVLPANEILSKKTHIANCVSNDVFSISTDNARSVFKTTVNWQDRWYAVHLQYRSKSQFLPNDPIHEYDPHNIKKLNTTIGQMLRYTFYGNKDFVD